MERVRLSPTALASVVAAVIVFASVTSAYVVKFFSSQHMTAKSKSGSIASACTQTPQSEKIYFVSCGGTF